MFEILTDEAKQLVRDAGGLARRYGCSHVGTEHLLVAALRVADHERRQRAAEAYDLTVLETALEARGTGIPSQGHVPFSPRVKEVLEDARARAQTSHPRVVRVRDIWRACLTRPDTGARAMLAEIGVRVDVRHEDQGQRGTE